jgi:hypothetical protein
MWLFPLVPGRSNKLQTVPLALILVIVVLGVFLIKPRMHPSVRSDIQQVEGMNIISDSVEEAKELAIQAFRQTHTQPIVQVDAKRTTLFMDYDVDTDTVTAQRSTSSYRVSIYYERTLRYPDGTAFVTYRSDYWVDVAAVKIALDKNTRDSSIYFIHRFVGTGKITSIQQAIETYFMLIERSPGRTYWICSFPEDTLRLAASKQDDAYNVTGAFRNYAVNCVAELEVPYNLYTNGTAILGSVKTMTLPVNSELAG